MTLDFANLRVAMNGDKKASKEWLSQLERAAAPDQAAAAKDDTTRFLKDFGRGF